MVSGKDKAFKEAVKKKMYNKYYLISIILLSILVVSNQLDFLSNSIIGEPEINCGHGEIKFNIHTKNGTPSTIFVKGNSENEECSFKNTLNATIQLDKCNMRRKREVNPDGVAYSMTVIVQMHPLFITKLDRAYNVHCFYMEASKNVNLEMQVSDLTTVVLDTVPEMPQCSYSVHRDSPNGPVIHYAHIGMSIYHVWDCPSTVYAMLVHSCQVFDGQGNEQMLVDNDGCSTDKYLMPELTYNDDKSKTFASSSAFNFPDRNSVYFKCQIKLCYKTSDDCSQIVPPRCGDNRNINKTTINMIDEDLNEDQLIGTTTEHTEKVYKEEQTTPKGRSYRTTTEETFPTPSELNISEIEGSGIEETTTMKSTFKPTTASIKILKTKGTNRSQRDTPVDSKRLVDFDISSPELTIIDDYFQTPEQSPQLGESAQYVNDLTSPKTSSSNDICVPIFVLFAIIGIFIILSSILIFVVANLRRTWTKFY
ncbi:Zona pellucida domain-containing protein [Strongyloides ratti]|uniref:Zona pellucida domain-containing protein n=1 Tax=Strongyloides ratti TaxID=34506 RepID=A0A090N0Y7_STRRB|nr:Zona pellucida domain-containing protein [Strongyloides ratti]CEF71508.1 Zona pellucida domain-containing protein [Strongyloides ratti]